MVETSGPRKLGASARILATGTELFAKFGYNGVSTREIAAAAHVNEVTIYRHFARKHDFYVAVLESELQRVHLRGDLLTNIAEATDGRTAIARACELLEKTFMHSPKMLRLVHYAALELKEDFDPLLRKHLGEFIEVTARYLEPWVQAGELRRTYAKTAILTLISIIISQDSLRRVFFGKAFGAESTYTAFSNLVLFDREAKKGPIASPSPAEIISDRIAEESAKL
jgi:AcrR family transcriptional regulator